MPSKHLILCRPLLLPLSILPSIRVFSNESLLCITWPKYWSFSFNISPSNDYSGLISFRMDWLDLLAVQGPLKSLLQYHSSKASILQYSAPTNLKKNYSCFCFQHSIPWKPRAVSFPSHSLLWSLRITFYISIYFSVFMYFNPFFQTKFIFKIKYRHLCYGG